MENLEVSVSSTAVRGFRNNENMPLPRFLGHVRHPFITCADASRSDTLLGTSTLMTLSREEILEHEAHLNEGTLIDTENWRH